MLNVALSYSSNSHCTRATEEIIKEARFPESLILISKQAENMVADRCNME